MLDSTYSTLVSVVMSIFQYNLAILPLLPIRKKLHGFLYFYEAKTGKVLWFHRIFNPNDSFTGNRLYNPKKILGYAKEAEENAKILLDKKYLLTSHEKKGNSYGAIKVKKKFFGEKSLILSLRTNFGEKIDEGVLIIFALSMGWLNKYNAYRMLGQTIKK